MVLGNFQCRTVIGQGPTVLAFGAGGGCMDIFFFRLPSIFFSLSVGDGPI